MQCLKLGGMEVLESSTMRDDDVAINSQQEAVPTDCIEVYLFYLRQGYKSDRAQSPTTAADTAATA